ncbi:cytochrome ubiquinol oxidase subunit I [Pimelobacter sp. 30-1]|uniref:cytochrome ubiquinol oxidase subunit I n=1 Tax=Pimelobacter sp. 30-1 TaxID=2004991 RepID=UPI0027E2E603|nr:cytochrome ubiquinol oxidase subunit I [Pimelobacter sp. 30-1]
MLSVDVLTHAVTEVATQVASAAPDEPAGLMPARQQMALSLGWHIILACFGVAFPAMIFVIHLRGIRKNDPVALGLAQRWAKVSAVLFAIGAVSGTVLSFEMGLLWPGLMGKYGDVLGLPFAFEGLAFFLEAIFLGIYLYGWNRMPPKRHVLMVLPMAITGIIGAYCVLAVNAWMNVPTGFRLVDGEVTDVEPWKVLFNGHTFLQFAHMWVGAYMLAGFTIAGVYAVGMLRGRRDAHHRLGFMVPFVFASIAAVTQPFVGHVLGFGLDERQPAKLAAFELAETTESPSPLRLGGVMIDGEVKYSIDIPLLGSLIAMNSPDKPVPGLDTIPEEDHPPINMTHLAFQTMVGIGTLLAGAVVLFWVQRRRGKDLLEKRWFLRFAAIAGPLAVIALEAGWIATEVGRQPWIVYGIMRTPEAVGDYTASLWWLLGISTVVYTTMTIGAVVVLRSMARRWRAGDVDLPSPYAPDPEPASEPEAHR